MNESDLVWTSNGYDISVERPVDLDGSEATSRLRFETPRGIVGGGTSPPWIRSLIVSVTTPPRERAQEVPISGLPGL